MSQHRPLTRPTTRAAWKRLAVLLTIALVATGFGAAPPADDPDLVQVTGLWTSPNSQEITVYWNPATNMASPVAYEIWYFNNNLNEWKWVAPADASNPDWATQKNVGSNSMSTSSEPGATYQAVLELPAGLTGSTSIGVRARQSWAASCGHPTTPNPGACTDIIATAAPIVAPIDNLATTPAAGQVTLDWDPAAHGPTPDYEISYQPTAGGTPTTQTVPAGNTQTTIAGLNPVPYDFTLTAEHDPNNDGTFVYGTDTTIAATPLAVGQPEITEIVVVHSAQYKMLWSDPDTQGDRTYEVTTSPDGNPVTSQTSVPAGPPAGLQNIALASPASNNHIESVTVKVCPDGNACTNPNGPIEFAVTTIYNPVLSNVTATSVGVAWSYQIPDPTLFDHYEIDYRPTGTTTWTSTPEVTTKQTTISGLTPDTEYEFAIRAIQHTNPRIVTQDATTGPITTLAGGGGTGWDPHRARDEAGAVLPYQLQAGDPAGTITVDDSGGADYLTIAEALTVATPSDVILVHDGIYRESLGQIDEKVTIRAADNAHPVVLGTDLTLVNEFTEHNGSPTTRWANIWATNPLLSLDSSPALDESDDNAHYHGLVDGDNPADLLPEQVFRVDNNDVWHELTQVRCDGGDNNWDSSGTAPPVDSFSYDHGNQRFYVHLSATDWTGTQHFEISNRQEAIRFNSTADESSITGLEFRAFSPRTDKESYATIAVSGYQSKSDRLEDIALDHVKVTDSAFTGIQLQYVDSTTLTHVTASGNVAKGLNSNRAHNLRIEFSRFDDNNDTQLDDSEDILAGVKISGNDGDDDLGIVVRYNSFANNDTTGFWCDLWCENADIVGNYVANNTDNGIYYEVSEDATIASNLIIGNQAAGIKVSGSQNVKITRNTFAGNTEHLQIASDIGSRADDSNRRPQHPTIVDTQNIDIEGNLFVDPAGTETPILNPDNYLEGGTGHHLPSQRIDTYDRNAYATTTRDTDYRCVWDGAEEADTPLSFWS